MGAGVGVNFKKNEYVPLVDHFLEGFRCPGKQRGIQQDCFPLLKGWVNMQEHPDTIN